MNRPDINVTPLIDVLLVLLIIFMVVAPLKPTHIESKVPQEPDNKTITPHPWTLVVEVKPDRTLALNSDDTFTTPRKFEDLSEKLNRIFETRSRLSDPESVARMKEGGKTVFVKAPRSLPYGEVVKVIDAVKVGGADPVSLQIDELGNKLLKNIIIVCGNRDSTVFRRYFGE